MHFYFTIHQGVFAQNKVCLVGVNSLLRCLNLRIRFDKFCCLFWRFCFYFLSILTVFVILYILLFFSSFAIEILEFEFFNERMSFIWWHEWRCFWGPDETCSLDYLWYKLSHLGNKLSHLGNKLLNLKPLVFDFIREMKFRRGDYQSLTMATQNPNCR